MNDTNLWGLREGKGGATQPEGEVQVKFYPHKKWDRKGLSHPEARAEKVCGSLSAEPFSNIKGGPKRFPPFKRVLRKPLPCLQGGAQEVSEPRFSHFVAPPSA